MAMAGGIFTSIKCI